MTRNDLQAVARADGWARVDAWLRSSDAYTFVDEAVLGGLPRWEAEELLEEYGLESSPANLRELGRRVDRALCEGVA